MNLFDYLMLEVQKLREKTGKDWQSVEPAVREFCNDCGEVMKSNPIVATNYVEDGIGLVLSDHNTVTMPNRSFKRRMTATIPITGSPGGPGGLTPSFAVQI